MFHGLCRVHVSVWYCRVVYEWAILGCVALGWHRNKCHDLSQHPVQHDGIRHNPKILVNHTHKSIVCKKVVPCDSCCQSCLHSSPISGHTLILVHIKRYITVEYKKMVMSHHMSSKSYNKEITWRDQLSVIFHYRTRYISAVDLSWLKLHNAY